MRTSCEEADDTIDEMKEADAEPLAMWSCAFAIKRREDVTEAVPKKTKMSVPKNSASMERHRACQTSSSLSTSWGRRKRRHLIVNANVH